jgi:hypothetical protein
MVFLHLDSIGSHKAFGGPCRPPYWAPNATARQPVDTPSVEIHASASAGYLHYMSDRNALDQGPADRPAEPQPMVERVRVVGGPLHGNTYAVTSRPDAAVAMESLGGTCIYRYTSVGGGEPLLQFVGPAAPVVSS